VRAVEFVRGGVRRWWVWRRGGRLCSLVARLGRRRYCGRAGLGRGISWRLCALLGGADGGREAVDRPASCVRPPATRRSLSTQSSSLCRLPIPGGRRRLQLLGSLQDPSRPTPRDNYRAKLIMSRMEAGEIEGCVTLTGRYLWGNGIGFSRMRKHIH
jgi:hypothetical protein